MLRNIMAFFEIEQGHSFLRIWSHLLKKSLMENFIFVQWIEAFCFTEDESLMVR